MVQKVRNYHGTTSPETTTTTTTKYMECSAGHGGHHYRTCYQEADQQRRDAPVCVGILFGTVDPELLCIHRWIFLIGTEEKNDRHFLGNLPIGGHPEEDIPCPWRISSRKMNTPKAKPRHGKQKTPHKKHRKQKNTKTTRSRRRWWQPAFLFFSSLQVGKTGHDFLVWASWKQLFQHTLQQCCVIHITCMLWFQCSHDFFHFIGNFCPSLYPWLTQLVTDCSAPLCKEIHDRVLVFREIIRHPCLLHVFERFIQILRGLLHFAARLPSHQEWNHLTQSQNQFLNVFLACWWEFGYIGFV